MQRPHPNTFGPSGNQLWRVTSIMFGLAIAILGMYGCGDSLFGDEASTKSTPGPSDGAETGTGHQPVERLVSFGEAAGLDRHATGDLDAVIDRGYLRALVPYSKTHYFLDGARQRGVAYESLVAFERFLNQTLANRHMRVEVVILPVARDELIEAVSQGLGDLAVANLTITPERRKQVDFSDPIVEDVHEVLVTGPMSPPLDSLDDLAGRTVHVRRTSSYWASLQTLSDNMTNRGLAPIDVVAADEYLEDEDLMELVAAGDLPWVVVDEPKALFWADVLNDIVVRSDLVLRSGGEIAWAFRRNSPQLAEVVNEFLRSHREGTLLGNVILKRYLQKNPWARTGRRTDEQRRLDAARPLFAEYGDRYDVSPVILLAMAYQESRLDNSKRSPAGAIGIMQIKPSTAADRNVGISGVETLENNIHAGTKYLAFLRDRYFSGPELDELNRVFFSLAAYNAGPARVRSLRAEAEAEAQGLNPNLWFGHVEQIAARRIGREPVQYVGNIVKYAYAYRLVYGERLHADPVD
jgi:membrane-bound lytic murein transglycosylase MltF